MSEKEFDELIKVASSDIFDEDFDLDGNTESVEVSHRHKIKMNRFFENESEVTSYPTRRSTTYLKKHEAGL